MLEPAAGDGELPLVARKLAMKKKRCPIPKFSKSPLLPLSHVKGVKNVMSPPRPQQLVQSKEWEKYFYVDVRAQTESPIKDIKSGKAFCELDSGGHASQANYTIHRDQRGWESTSCEVISQTSKSSPSQEQEVGYSRTSQAHRFLKQNMASPQAVLDREGSSKQSIVMFSPSLFTLDDDCEEEEELMRKCFLGEGPDKSCLISRGQLRPRSSCLMRKKSAQRRSTYHKEVTSAALRGPRASGYQDNGGSGESLGPIAEVQNCNNFSNTKSCDQSKLRRCEEASSSMAAAECLKLAVPKNEDQLAVIEISFRSISQKYRPKVFEEIVGQHIVSQSLSNAITKGKIAPGYLFQGPRGTGKTSAARIFASALLCVGPQEQRPCGLCTECSLTWLGKNAHVKEVDAASHNGIAKVIVLLEEINLASVSSVYKVFIIDECHVLTAETWSALLKILEEPPLNVVLILITTDSDKMPLTAVSRCQKFPFPKIKDGDIIKRLAMVASQESLELDLEVLRLIASRADGSLRDAEMILDQLGLLGQEISSSTINELVGSASEGRILSLLESALRADTVNTIKKARELVDSGVQPLSLMSQMATLIIDILAGSYEFTDEQSEGFFHRQTFSESKLERLHKAVRILSEGEKQLRLSNDRMTWLTATLLQLGPDRSCKLPTSAANTSLAQSPMTIIDTELGAKFITPAQSFSRGDFEFDGLSQNSSMSTRWAPLTNEQENSEFLARPIAHGSVEEDPLKDRQLETLHSASSNLLSVDKPRKEHELSASKLADIWSTVVQNCRPFRLRQSLNGHGKLVSISIQDGSSRVHLEFFNAEHKTRCERLWRNITDLFEAVLGSPVELRLEQGGLTFPEQTDPRKSLGKEILGTDCEIPIQSVCSICDSRQPCEMDALLPKSRPPSGASTLKDLLKESTKKNAAISCFATTESLREAEEQLDKAWICDDAEECIPTTRTYCFEAHGWSCEEVKEVVEANRTSPSSRTIELRDKPDDESRNILDGIEGNQNDDTSKAVHRLALRIRNRSFPGDYQNLLMETESPPFAILHELHKKSRSSNETRLSGNIAVLSTMKPASKAVLASQLRNKLKGAAGIIARFFSRKTLKEPTSIFG